ncbi:leucine-rich repeat domain-containing protein [Wolbachia endosymbiont of Ctenocephalides felis wCfeT]|uniref:hypothetical protein n=1 Tax=Wolbachia endosymbiont of Ctenocephalides felis wCfeT TaxID=2732593 RepID=UPI001446F6B4|nr:hypothetical protein [Wolbachia endosymbiont of Ctenocephalides felis wCfeT]
MADYFSYFNIIEEGILTIVRSNRGDGSDKTLEEVFEEISKREDISKIKEFNLSCGILDEDVEVVTNFLRKNKNLIKNLTSLDLRGSQIGDEGVKVLAEYLEESNIISLNLSWNNIEDKGAKALAEALKGSNITSLNLSCNQIGYKGEKAMKKSKNPISLDLSWNPIERCNTGCCAFSGAAFGFATGLALATCLTAVNALVLVEAIKVFTFCTVAFTFAGAIGGYGIATSLNNTDTVQHFNPELSK